MRIGQKLVALAVGALLVGGVAPAASAHDDDHPHDPPPVATPDDSLRFVDPSTYAEPGHPSYDYYRTFDADPANDRTDLTASQYTVAEQFGCNVDHPYMRWLLDETRAVVDANYKTMRDVMLDGFTPLGPIPNDFGYPDTYWHWWNQTRSRPRWQDRPGGAQPENTREWTVQPQDLQHLLLVPAYWEGEVPTVVSAITGEEATNEQTEGEATDGWVTAGVMYATEFDTPPVYGDAEGFYAGCQPFHSHDTGIDTPHLHMWLRHHNHPMAMNPPHLCDEYGEPKDAPYGPLDPTRDTSTWNCLHHEDPHEHGAATQQSEPPMVSELVTLG